MTFDDFFMELRIEGTKLRVDIVDKKNNEIYEIKPDTWTNRIEEILKNQVKNYCETGKYKMGSKSIKGDFNYGSFTIHYDNDLCPAVIFYRFDKRTRNDYAEVPKMHRIEDGSVVSGVARSVLASAVVFSFGYAAVGFYVRCGGIGLDRYRLCLS